MSKKMTIHEWIEKIDEKNAAYGDNKKWCHGISCLECPFRSNNVGCNMERVTALYHEHHWSNKINELL